MSDGRVGRWRDMLREAVAVLGAILIAFALDAWWDARVERTDMLRALQSVVVELDENVAIADSILAETDQRLEALRFIASMTPEELAGLSDDDVLSIGEFRSVELMNPRVGAITAFIDGGFLAAVDDVELRNTVASIPSILDELSEETTQLLDLSTTVAAAASAARGAETLLASLGATPDAGLVRRFSEALRRSPDAMNALAARAIVMEIYQGELRTVARKLGESRARIATAR